MSYWQHYIFIGQGLVKFHIKGKKGFWSSRLTQTCLIPETSTEFVTSSTEFLYRKNRESRKGRYTPNFPSSTQKFARARNRHAYTSTNTFTESIVCAHTHASVSPDDVTRAGSSLTVFALEVRGSNTWERYT